MRAGISRRHWWKVLQGRCPVDSTTFDEIPF
jgi:hypothetical protein